MFGLTLITVLAVMGGLIAYIGDKIGTKVGKKKLSMFGLRPKYTSIIVAIVTGILITASTMAILTVSSRDVRTALFGMEQLRSDLAVVSAEVTQKNEQLADNQRELREKEAEYNSLTERIGKVFAQLAGLEDELARAIKQRDDTRAALTRAQEDYHNARGDLAKAKREIADLEATKTDLDMRINDLSKARDDLKEDVDRLATVTARLRMGIEQLRAGTVLYRANEVLTTAVVDVPAHEMREELLNILMETNHRILTRMGKPDEQLEALWISQSDFQDTLKTLENSDTSIVVRIVADGNTVLGEPVIGHFEIYPNRRIFRHDEIIARKNVNVDQNKENIEQVVLQFLQEVNTLAIARGVLPDPLQGTVGSIRGTELFNTVNQVRKMRGIVELTAVTQEDTSVAGPLRIRIQAVEQ